LEVGDCILLVEPELFEEPYEKYPHNFIKPYLSKHESANYNGNVARVNDKRDVTDAHSVRTTVWEISCERDGSAHKSWFIDDRVSAYGEHVFLPHPRYLEIFLGKWRLGMQLNGGRIGKLLKKQSSSFWQRMNYVEHFLKGLYSSWGGEGQ